MTLTKITRWLIPLLIFATHGQTDITFTKIRNPILPLSLGKAQITTHKHTFVKYVDISKFNEPIKNVKSNFKLIREQFVNIFPDLMYQAIDYEHLINNSLKLISNKIDNLKPLRFKRGLINLVGKGYKWLFGTLDADDGERYNKAINILDKNQQMIQHDLINQISVTKYFVSEVNICRDILHVLETLENSILFAKLHTLHSSILPIKEFEFIIKEMRQIYGQASIPLFNNVQSYYSLCSVEFYQKGNKLMFGIHIPILYTKSYDYFRLIPIPLNFQIIIPKKTYIFLNNTWHHYEDQQCTQIEDTCIYYIVNPITSRDCLPKVLTGKRNNTCSAKHVTITDDIIESINDNHVIVIPNNKIIIKQKCQTNGLHETTSPELINIQPGCCIVINEDTFCATRSEKEQLYELPLVNVDISASKERTIKLPHDVSLITLQDIKRNSEFLKVHDLLPMNSQTNKHSVLIYAIICIIFVIILICIYKFYVLPNKVILYNLFRKKVPQKQNGLNETEFKDITSENKKSLLFSS